MRNGNQLKSRWRWVAGYVSLAAVLVACAISGGATPGGTAIPAATQTEVVPLRLENGAIELHQETGGWIPVTGETTFEIAGVLESTDPWMVTGNTFATRETTQIGEGLEPGDAVRVEGVILEDGTWLAYSIERAQEEQPSSTITLIGKVASIDPWVVNGITLNVTKDTLISEGIMLEMIVRVEILLLEDGTWEVLSIVPLASFTDVPGCATVTATVVSVDGEELHLEGWPPITLGEDVIIEVDGGGEGTLGATQVVLVVVCASEDEPLIVTHIIILSGGEGGPPASGAAEKVLVCHKPDKKGGHTLSIASSAVSAHLGHGDKLGACP